jgi:hypothetical protein
MIHKRDEAGAVVRVPRTPAAPVSDQKDVGGYDSNGGSDDSNGGGSGNDSFGLGKRSLQEVLGNVFAFNEEQNSRLLTPAYQHEQHEDDALNESRNNRNNSNDNTDKVMQSIYGLVALHGSPTKKAVVRS